MKLCIAILTIFISALALASVDEAKDLSMFAKACETRGGQYYEDTLYPEWEKACAFDFRRSRNLPQPVTPSGRMISTLSEKCPSKDTEVFVPQYGGPSSLLIRCI